MHRSTLRILRGLPLGLAMVFLLPLEVGCDLVKKGDGVGVKDGVEDEGGDEGKGEGDEWGDGGGGDEGKGEGESYSGGDEGPGDGGEGPGDGGEGPGDGGEGPGDDGQGDGGEVGGDPCEEQFQICLAEGNFVPLCEKLLGVCQNGGYEAGDEGGPGGDEGPNEGDGGEVGGDDGRVLPGGDGAVADELRLLSPIARPAGGPALPRGRLRGAAAAVAPEPRAGDGRP